MNHRCAWAVMFVTGFSASTLSASPGTCGTHLPDYQGYTVSDVKVTHVIPPLTGLTPGLSGIAEQLQTKVNGPFDVTGYSNDAALITKTVREADASGRQPLKIILTVPRIAECDSSSRTLHVTYTVFTNILGSAKLPEQLPTTPEQQQHEAERPVATLATQAVESSTQIVPLFGYGQSSATFGGFRLSTKLNANTKLQMDSAISTQIRQGEAKLTGIAPDWLLNAHWAVGMDYKDTPIGSARVQAGKLTARISGASKQSSPSSLMFRYGGAFEAGHQQSAGLAPAVSKLVPNSSLGSLKFYAGVAQQLGEDTWSASGAVQVGSTQISGSSPFAKYLFDAAYTTRLPRQGRDDPQALFTKPSAGVHRKLDLDLRVTGGWLANAGAAPFEERFFGGNQIQPFVSDSDWIIPADAFIRSIPESRLGATPTSRGIGGSRFYSTNLTLSVPVWGRPVLPSELATDEFVQKLNFLYGSAQETVAQTIKTDDPTYKKALAAMQAELTALGTTIQNLLDVLDKAPTSPDTVGAAVDQAETDLMLAQLTLGAAQAGQAATLATLITSSLPTVINDVTAVNQALTAASQSTVVDQLTPLLKAIQASRGTLSQDQTLLDDSKYLHQAAFKLSSAHRFLNVFLHELNLYSIAPVALADMAQVWPTGVGNRYALGGGLRFGLVNTNFTAVYAWNPHRLNQEKAGAFFFKLDVTNFFR